MEPIVTPWVFYLTSVADDVNFVSRVASVLAGILLSVAVIVKIFIWVDSYVDEADDLLVKMNSIIKKSTIALALSLLIGTIVPEETTITKMVIAKNITYDRVSTATDVVGEVYADIMGLFDEVEAQDG